MNIRLLPPRSCSSVLWTTGIDEIVPMEDVRRRMAALGRESMPTEDLLHPRARILPIVNLDDDLSDERPMPGLDPLEALKLGPLDIHFEQVDPRQSMGIDDIRQSDQVTSDLLRPLIVPTNRFRPCLPRRARHEPHGKGTPPAPVGELTEDEAA